MTEHLTIEAFPGPGSDLEQQHEPRPEAEITHASIRQELLQNETLRSALVFAAEQQATFLPSTGNLGDGLIQLGTFDLLNEFGLAPQFQELSPASLEGRKLAVIGGGGGWLKGLWEHTSQVISPFLDEGGEVIILPSSISGFEQYFSRYASQMTIFAREQVSFERLMAVPALKGRVHLCHDLAFALHPKTFSELKQRKGSGTLSIFRLDPEGRQTSFPPSNIDMALRWNGDIWHSREACLEPLTVAAGIMCQFDHVQTDRLHMTALAAMLGRQVTMNENSYFKNRAVFEKTLHRFQNVSLLPRSGSAPADDERDETTSASRTAALPIDEPETVSGSETTKYIRNEFIALMRLRHEWFEPEIIRLQKEVQECRHTSQALHNEIERQQHGAAQATAEAAALKEEVRYLKTKLEQRRDAERKLQQQLEASRSRIRIIEGSRWYKAWRLYLQVYGLPVLGSFMRCLRKAAGRIVRMPVR